jgi:GT2 family glycosyltransferase
MELVPDDAWACLLDHDFAWTTREWKRQLIEAIQTVPEAGLITAVTNRIGAKWQRAEEVDRNLMDMVKHRQIGKQRMQRRTLLDITDTKGFGGVVMCLSKKAWAAAGGFADGLLCVDHSMHFRLRDAGYRIYMLESLYVWHWRRFGGDELPTDTPRAENCPCRGVELMPTVRIALPKAAA